MNVPSKPEPSSLPELVVARAATGPAGIDSPEWNLSDSVAGDRYWSGETAPEGRRFEARLLWSASGLHVRFRASQTETPVVSQDPVTDEKTIGLWDRDVCEIFLAPGSDTPNEYFEFEVAPTGEWLDLAIRLESGERITNWEFVSGMTAEGKIGEDIVEMSISVPWDVFGIRPDAGDAWRGNLFRAVGSGEERGYLAWSPTYTERPNFHVPERFGKFLFGE